MIKLLIHISLFLSAALTMKSGYHLGGWKNVTDQEKTHVSELLSVENHKISILDGMTQLVSGTNYAIVIQSDKIEKCFIAFNYAQWRKAAPIQMISNKNVNVISIKGAAEVANDCTEENHQLLMSKFAPKEELEDIEEVVQEFNGGWKSMDQVQLSSFEELVAVGEFKPKALKGVNQVVAGLNYMVVVQNGEEEPCILALYHVPWSSTNKVSLLSQENCCQNTIQSALDNVALCGAEIQNLVVGKYQQLVVRQKKRKNAEIMIWQPTIQDESQIIETALELQKAKLTMDQNILKQVSNKTSFMIPVTTESDDKFILFAVLNPTNSSFQAEFTGENAFTQNLINSNFPGVPTCTKEMVESVNSTHTALDSFNIMMANSLLTVTTELSSICTQGGLGSWKLMEPGAVSDLASNIKVSELESEIVGGIMKVVRGMDYMLIIKNQNQELCSLYMNFIFEANQNKLDFESPASKETIKNLIKSVKPCTEALAMSFEDINSPNDDLLII